MLLLIIYNFKFELGIITNNKDVLFIIISNHESVNYMYNFVYMEDGSVQGK